MNTPTYEAINSLPEFITGRLDDAMKRRRRPRQSIARLAGLESERTLELFAAGTVKVPMDLAVRLAEALECDPRSMAIAVLQQYAPKAFVDLITDERRRVAQNDAAIVTVTAVAVELINLKETMLTFTKEREVQEPIIKGTETIDRLVLECRKVSAGLDGRV